MLFNNVGCNALWPFLFLVFWLGQHFGGIKPILGTSCVRDASNGNITLLMYSQSFVSDIFSTTQFCITLEKICLHLHSPSFVVAWVLFEPPLSNTANCVFTIMPSNVVKPFWTLFVGYWVKYFQNSCVTKFNEIIYVHENLLIFCHIF